eukprot:jgi/Botrbrau1/8017/Bobra.384_2s0039.1
MITLHSAFKCGPPACLGVASSTPGGARGPGHGQHRVPVSASVSAADSHVPRGGPWPRCGQEMDRFGDHAIQCRVGRRVAVTYRHNAVRDMLFRIGKEVEAVVTREPPLPVRVVGFETRRPDLVFLDWDGGRDLYVDVVGTSPLAASYLAGGGEFVPGGAAAGKLASYREVVLRQPPRVVFRPFAFETFGGLDSAAEEFLKRLQGMVNQALVAHEDLVWFSTHRRVSFAIARAVGRQLAA